MDMKTFRGLSGTYDVRANERDRGAPRNHECLVQFLNNTQQIFVIDRNSKGQYLLDAVFKYLNLIETDFFGLKFLPQESQRQNELSLNTNGTNDNNHNNNGIITNLNCKNSSTLSPKTNSLNSYDHSPSPNASISSSSSPPVISKLTTQTNQIDQQNSNTSESVNINNNVKSNTHSPIPSAITVAINNNQHSFQSNVDANDATDEINKSSLVEERWLNPKESIRKQYKSGPPYKFWFRVKFYVSDPCKLADDTTRHHLYLQLRQDILNNRLIVPTCSAILLASYILQSEVGDYKRELQEENYASNFKLLPNLSDDIKKKVIELHKQHKSLTSADAEYQFLEHAAKKLDCYGVEFYEAQDQSKADVKIGVSSNGIVVYKDNRGTAQFSWAKIMKIIFKKKIFFILLRRDQNEICDNIIEYNLLTNQACKLFWKECVAQHSFFRLHQPKSPPKKFFSFLNFGSKFQYIGKTEYQTMEESRKRSFSHFSRTPSKRYARRTIPIGKPSWSESSIDKKVSLEDDNDCRDGEPITSEGGEKELDLTEQAIISHQQQHINNNNIVNSSWLFTAPSSSTSKAKSNVDANQSLNNVSVDPRLSSSAYRPKSLTLKSFMYIDESKNFITSGGEHSTSNQFTNNNENLHRNNINSNNCCENSNVSQCLPDNNNHDTTTATTNALRKDLKRSESMKISSSIKGALSLTKKAGISSGSHLAKISESLRDKFLVSKSKVKKTKSNLDPILSSSSSVKTMTRIDSLSEDQDSEDIDETSSEMSTKIVKLSPGRDGKYGFKIRKVKYISNSNDTAQKSKEHSIIINDISPLSPAATCDPRIYEEDQLIAINGKPIHGLSLSKVENLIKNIQNQNPPDIILEVKSRFNNRIDDYDDDSSTNYSEIDDRLSPESSASESKRSKQIKTLADSIKVIKKKLAKKDLIDEFDKLSRKNEDETLNESKLSENIDKNRYRDILPYDSTRVQLIDSMTGDYINASYVDMPVPSGSINRYIATQGPLASTCDDFWQMVWEQNCSLIIMVTPLIESGRVKCHKYWPNEKEDIRYGQILIRNLAEKSKSATINRKIQLVDVKSGEKRMTTQIQYKAWPDHEVPEDCSDFLKLVNRVRKHRLSKPNDPIVVHCSAGIGRTGVLILMETAICIMESGEPVYPIKILQEMRKQRAMLIQTNSQFQFVAEAICRVYDQKLYKKLKKYRKK